MLVTENVDIVSLQRDRCSPWGKVVAIRLFRAREKPGTPSRWLEHLIHTIRVLDGASALAPFPYIKVAAGITLQVLETIQTARRNQQEFYDLADSLVLTIVAIRETLVVHHDKHIPSSAFASKCHEYVQFLLELLACINATVRKTRSWMWFLNYGSIRDHISTTKKKIDDLRSTFMIMTMTDLYLHVYRYMPRGMPTINSTNLVRLIDAMDLTIDVPMELCATRSDFDDFLKFIFRKRRGRSYVDLGLYDLADVSTTDRPLTAALWSFAVKPGATLVMNIILERRPEQESPDSRRCPACQLLCKCAELGEEVACPSCGTHFRVSSGIIEEIEQLHDPERAHTSPHASGLPQTPAPSSHPAGSPMTNTESFDIRDFRRFHVLELAPLSIVPQLSNPTFPEHLFPPSLDSSPSSSRSSSPDVLTPDLGFVSSASVSGVLVYDSDEDSEGSRAGPRWPIFARHNDSLLPEALPSTSTRPIRFAPFPDPYAPTDSSDNEDSDYAHWTEPEDDAFFGPGTHEITAPNPFLPAMPNYLPMQNTTAPRSIRDRMGNISRANGTVIRERMGLVSPTGVVRNRQISNTRRLEDDMAGSEFYRTARSFRRGSGRLDA